MISQSSPLAKMFASLIVFASSYEAATERYQQNRSAIAAVKLRPSLRRAWVRAIANDDTAKLAAILLEDSNRALLLLSASDNRSALMVAAEQGDMVLARSLVRLGADVNEATDTCYTPLMFAVERNHQQLAEWLLDQGADINTVASNGWTALTIAAARGNVRILQWLISEGASTQTRDVYGFTPLLRAVDESQAEAAAVLLSLVETDINARNEHDNTPLHFAVSKGDAAMVRLLLEHQANPNLLNKKGDSPMQIAFDLAGNSNTILSALSDTGLH